jgi:tetratricopeptide (TPR) repeat protein
MPFFTFLFVILGVVLSAYGQVSIGKKSTADSLERVFATTKEDTTRGRTLCRLCEEYKNTGKLDRAWQAGQKGLQISQTNHDEKGMAECYFHIGIYHGVKGNTTEQKANLEKSLELYKKVNDPMGIARSMNNLGVYYFNKSEDKKALEYFTQGLAIREKIGYQKGIVLSLRNLIIILNKQYNLPQALDYAHRALKISERNKDPKAVAGILYYI